MRRSHALILPVLLLLALAACGGSSSSNGNGNGGESQAAQESQAAESQAAQESHGGGSNTDIDQVASDLVPPNSSETSRTTASGVIFVTYDSTDSPDSLKSFYDDAIDQLGWYVFSQTSAGGSYSWIIGETETADAAGSITLGPGGDGTGSSVLIQIGTGS